MKYLLIILAILILSILQTGFLGINLLLLLVLVAGFAFEERLVFSIAFSAGVFLDLFSGHPLGFSSLAFVLISFLIIIYRQRFSFQNPLILSSTTFLTYFLFTQVLRVPVDWLEGVLLAILMIFARFLVPFLFKRREGGQLVVEV